MARNLPTRTCCGFASSLNCPHVKYTLFGCEMAQFFWGKGAHMQASISALEPLVGSERACIWYANAYHIDPFRTRQISPNSAIPHPTMDRHRLAAAEVSKLNTKYQIYF